MKLQLNDRVMLDKIVSFLKQRQGQIGIVTRISSRTSNCVSVKWPDTKTTVYIHEDYLVKLDD